MSDKEFLDYCAAHATTPRSGFYPEQLARLYGLAGDEQQAALYAGLPHQVVNCDSVEILQRVAQARVNVKG